MRVRPRSLFLTLLAVLLQVSACQAQPQVTIAQEGSELTFQVEVRTRPLSESSGCNIGATWLWIAV
jgi:hypothetical protein